MLRVRRPIEVVVLNCLGDRDKRDTFLVEHLYDLCKITQ